MPGAGAGATIRGMDEQGIPILVAVDTGGTFTDVVALRDGRLLVHKLPSTPDDPARAVIDGIRAVARGIPPADLTLVHGSTVATNALLERDGAHVALVTNRGFEDVIEIGRQNRPQLYALVGHRPPPLVARGDRLGISGRIGPAGEEIEPLDGRELQELPARIPGGVQSIAICLLHSYANAAHEESVAGALEGLGLPISVSSRLLPEYREYERTATTVVNAFVAPRMQRYLGRLARDSGAGRVRIMGSGGGALPISRAVREPVHTVLSGPAGGIIGALEHARRAGITDILTFDMGGTSTDVSLCPGRPLHTREFEIGGLPVAVPVLDIHTVGAGGGSIAWVDAGGALRVGPRSAGAQPGPICYGLGGTEVTVTDAHVWLGRIPAEARLAGGRLLDRDAIAGPLADLARALGLSTDAAAEGILDVANVAMEGALRVISVERGYDPAASTLLPFGGAAGLHAVELAERLGIPRVLLPTDPGVLSAFGMLVSPVRKEAARTVLSAAAVSDGASLQDTMLDLEAEVLAAMAGEGIPARGLTIERIVDARYRGQSYELRVQADGWVERFHQAHETRYGYRQHEEPVEAVTARVIASATAPALPVPRLSAAGDTDPPTREVTVVHRGAPVAARLVDRSSLLAAHRIIGPAVVLEYSATTWLPPDWKATVQPDGALLAGPATP